MARGKYSILLMRDDSKVKRFRLSPVWLKLFIYFIVFCVLAAGVGIYGGYTFWRENMVLTQERKAQERSLREMQVELERLQNVEQILESNDPEELQSLFGNISVAQQQPEQPEPPTLDLAKIFDYMDKRQVIVENFSASLVNNGRSLRISFELNNADSAKPLSGLADVDLVTRTGKTIKIKPDRNDMTFLIQRFKKVVTSIALPAGTALDDLFGLRLNITTPEGDLIYSDIYRLSRVLS